MQMFVCACVCTYKYYICCPFYQSMLWARINAFHHRCCVLISITACKCQQMQIVIFQFSIKKLSYIHSHIQTHHIQYKYVKNVVKSGGSNPLLIYERTNLTFLWLLFLSQTFVSFLRREQLSVPRAKLF